MHQSPGFPLLIGDELFIGQAVEPQAQYIPIVNGELGHRRELVRRIRQPVAALKAVGHVMRHR